MSYEYDLDEGKVFADYNMESQGDIIADYFVLKFLNDPRALNANAVQKQYADKLPLYEKVLRDFIADPSNRKNLP